MIEAALLISVLLNVGAVLYALRVGTIVTSLIRSDESLIESDLGQAETLANYEDRITDLEARLAARKPTRRSVKA